MSAMQTEFRTKTRERVLNEKYLAEKELDLTATLDAKLAYSNTDFVVIAAPTNVYPKFSVEF